MLLKPKYKSNRVDFLAASETGKKVARFSWRLLIVYLLAIFVFTFLFFNLFDLEIIEGSQNLLVASRINQSENKVLPPRGLILDAAGNKLAYNVPAYSLIVNPNEIKETVEIDELRQLAGILGVDPDDFLQTYYSRIFNNDKRTTVSRVTIKSDLNFDQYLAVVSQIDKFKGVYILIEPVRQYTNSIYYANIIGYIGDPTQQDLDAGISSEAQVGKTGIESQYDDVLRGVEGIEISQKGVFDTKQHVYTPQEVKYGDNVVLSVDPQWQQKLTDIMQKQLIDVKAFASAGVIMNSRTGEIKAMVSIPDYDNNLFAKGISGKDFSTLINDPHTPLMNRDIGLQLPPGSDWKIIGATAALEGGVITEHTKFVSNRCMELPGKIKFCEADSSYLGELDLRNAIAKSSNIYFCNVALAINQKMKGIRTLMDYGSRYGIGLRTGVDLPGEQAGTMASPELKKRLQNEPWYTGDECNTIIGQGLVTTTPLQMTVVAAAVANGGEVLEPHLMSKVQNQDGDTIFENQPKVVRSLNVSSKTLDIIKSAMRLTAVSGTATGLGQIPGNVIAKTGSSEAGEYINGKYYSGAHSWVIGCFDYDNENYCFTVMQQWGGRGYKTVPIMKKFITCVYDRFADNCENK
jgi:penicillin-binding protein 2